MSRNEAVSLLQELVNAEVEVMKQINSNRGLTKKAVSREAKAVGAIFKALVGENALDVEIEVITGG